jgi:aryl-alcohol dehydrogenase
MREDGSTALKSADSAISSHFFGQSSFASYALAKRSNAIKVREDAPLELLGPLGCGVITGAGSIMKAMACEPDSRVVITGGGAVGLSAVLGAVVQKCSTIIVVEPHASRRELALSLGATHVIDPLNTENLTEALRQIAPDGLNYAFDTTSLQSIMDGIAPAMSQGGTIGLVGVPKPDATRLSFDVIVLLTFGIKVMGITEGDVNPVSFIPELIDLYMENRFAFDKLCKTYAFEDINNAVADQATGGCIKPILTF